MHRLRWRVPYATVAQAVVQGTPVVMQDCLFSIFCEHSWLRWCVAAMAGGVCGTGSNFCKPGMCQLPYGQVRGKTAAAADEASHQDKPAWQTHTPCFAYAALVAMLITKEYCQQEYRIRK